MSAPTRRCIAGCVRHPLHGDGCLPRPRRLYLCVYCAGQGFIHGAFSGNRLPCHYCDQTGRGL